MGSIDRIICTTVMGESVNPDSVVTQTVKFCACLAIVNKYLSYLSDFFLMQQPENIVYGKAGEWVNWKCGDKSITQFAAWALALIGDGSRCARQYENIPIAVEKVKRAYEGNKILPAGNSKPLKKMHQWIPASTIVWFQMQVDVAVPYILHVTWKFTVLAKEVLALIAYTNDLASTILWIPDSKKKNADRIIINMAEMYNRFIEDVPGTIEKLKNKRELIETLLKNRGSKINFDTYIAWLESGAKIIKSMNTYLSPIKQKASGLFVDGVNTVIATTGSDIRLSPPRTRKKGLENPSSPFKSPEATPSRTLKTGARRKLVFE